MSKLASREQQHLVYWLIEDYGRYLKSSEPREIRRIISKLTNKKKIFDSADYYNGVAKIELKKLYVKAHPGWFKGYEPFVSQKEEVLQQLRKAIKNKSDAEDIWDIIVDYSIKEFQILLMTLDFGFSLSLKLMSSKLANDFMNFMFDFYIDNEIPMKRQTSDIYFQRNHDRAVYTCLIKKVCAVCSSRKDIHFEHYKTAASLGGYANDYGQGEYWSLCSSCHSEKHHLGAKEFTEKHGKRGIKLKKEQVEEVKKIYPNHLQGNEKEGWLRNG